jgi:DNA polymerase-3 subunit delta'
MTTVQATPATLSAIRDQEVALRLLGNFMRSGRVPHGLLFWGPGGVGKRLSAYALARALNCREAEGDACGACLSCRKIDSGNHPDIKEVRPRGTSRQILMADIDDVTEFAMLRPYEGRYRVTILLDAERMNPTAQNHFLKTLEEPPGRSLFILVTEAPRVLLPTIRSRCQPVRFRRLLPDTVVELLERQHALPDDTARAIAALAQGRMDRAYDLLTTDKRAQMLDATARLGAGEDPMGLAAQFAGVIDAQRKARADEVKKRRQAAAKDPEVREREGVPEKEEVDAEAQALIRRDILDYLYLFETWYRDELVYRATGDAERVLNRDCVDRLAARTSTDAAAKIAALERARGLLDRFINEERVFTELFFALARP